MKRALIWDLMYEIDPDLEDEYDLSALEDFVRNKRAMVNTRYDYGDPRRPNQNYPEWGHWHADDVYARWSSIHCINGWR